MSYDKRIASNISKLTSCYFSLWEGTGRTLILDLLDVFIGVIFALDRVSRLGFATNSGSQLAVGSMVLFLPKIESNQLLEATDFNPLLLTQRLGVFLLDYLLMLVRPLKHEYYEVISLKSLIYLASVFNPQYSPFKYFIIGMASFQFTFPDLTTLSLKVFFAVGDKFISTQSSSYQNISPFTSPLFSLSIF